MFSDHITVDSIIIVINRRNDLWNKRLWHTNIHFHSLLFLQHSLPKKFKTFIGFDYHLKERPVNHVNACLITQSDDVLFSHNINSPVKGHVVKHLLCFTF